MTPAAVEPCPACGFDLGHDACRDLFNDVTLRVRELAWTGSLPTWRLMHDVYFVQHEEEHCARYKGLVMHLGGLCWALEHDGSEPGYRALQQLVERNPWEGQPYPPAPGIPKDRGTVTIASLKDAASPDRLVAGVDRWARATWLAYADLQGVAREWVDQALKLREVGAR